MIEHVPYGIDDPYKSAATERFPRDPAPGEDVQVGFRTEPDATEAWLQVRHVAADGETSEFRVEATSLGGGLWTASIGPFPDGRVEYELVSQRGLGQRECERFAFDVGSWVEVTGIERVRPVQGGVLLDLLTNGSPASVVVSYPTVGACRLQLYAHESTAPAEQGGTTPDVEDDGATIRIRGAGLVLSLDRRKLDYTVGMASASQDRGAFNPFTGSLAMRWLARDGAFSTPVEARFDTRPGERFYGLGERFTDADRNGQSWDVRVYEEYKEQGKRTYIPVPFLVSNLGYGLWLDANEPSLFDLTGSTATVSCDRLTPGPSDASALLDLCVFAASRPYDVTAAFTRLTGTIAVPPKWAFGPWMSANTWNRQSIAEEVVDRTLTEQVPATVIVLEAWSDEATFYIFNDARYEPVPGAEAHSLRDFEFGGRWPDPKGFIDRCHENGIRVVLWQIPVHKKLDEAHPQHDADGRHMAERGFAIRNEDGTPYRNRGWWFPDAMILDFTNPHARDWWFAKRRYLVDQLGVDGFKTDGGEHLWGRDLRAHDGSRGLQLVNTYANRYVEAYHEFVQDLTGGDGVTFSRSGYTGAQRFPIHWAGDEDSTWNAYRASIRAGLSAGVSGVSMWSWDIAGFSGEIPTPELYLRSTAMAVFCPVMQYHSEAHGATERRDRTPWNIAERHNDPTVLATYRRYARLRMRLIDYLHDEASATARLGLPLMRYPALEYVEEHGFLAQDEYAYLFGRDLLVAPVVERGVGTRAVRLPPGEWVDAWSGARLPGNRVFRAPAPPDRIPVFIKAESPRLDTLLRAFSQWRADEAG